MKEFKFILGFILLIALAFDLPAQKISAGGAHSMAICKDSTVKTWGYNNSGQLGNGTLIDNNIPIQINGLANIIAVSAGGLHSLALKSDGTVWSWGANFNGQLGNGTVIDAITPIKINSLSGIIAISAGQYFSLALKNDGTVWAWGNGQFGQLGNGANAYSSIPVQVSLITNITAIAAGGDHALALKSDSTVWCWGRNFGGQLGNGNTNDSNVPLKINNFGSVYAIAAGNYHSLALKQLASVWEWGFSNSSTIPVEINNIINPFYGTIKIAAGGDHSMAIKYNGRLRTWGDNSSGQLGNGTNINCTQPTQVTSFTTNASAIAAGGQHSLILKDDGSLWSTGANFFGQLGNGNNADTNVPVQVTGMCIMAVGIKEDKFSVSNEISFFPNPNNGSFNINIGQQIEVYDLLIYNSIGALVHFQKLRHSINKVNKPELVSGLYNCVLHSAEQKIYSFKIVIE